MHSKRLQMPAESLTCDSCGRDASHVRLGSGWFGPGTIHHAAALAAETTEAEAAPLMFARLKVPPPLALAAVGMGDARGSRSGGHSGWFCSSSCGMDEVHKRGGGERRGHEGTGSAGDGRAGGASCGKGAAEAECDERVRLVSIVAAAHTVGPQCRKMGSLRGEHWRWHTQAQLLTKPLQLQVVA